MATSIECPVCKGEGVDLEGYICWRCKGYGDIYRSTDYFKEIIQEALKQRRNYC